ncbi:MAG TPA: diaminopimelate epimerase [Candidatus Rubrimentiphilum sp.]|nr:diaminopimelate epimerase [Candidatus Rubrimentiphilum sp.]
MAVTKMHGTFNDFAVIDERKSGQIEDPASFARRICDRRGGIGCDGLILIQPSTAADVWMRIYNADGTEAEMCGNGLRCVVRYLSELGEGDRFRIETIAGIIPAQVLTAGDVYHVRAQIGVPHIKPKALPFPNAVYVEVGNPHVVILESALDVLDLVAVAAQLQPLFPSGVNVHLAVVLDGQTLDVRHWERGVGLTQACGTGAAACAAAAMHLGLAKSPVEVRVPGGVLRIEWDGKHEAFLTGPAVRVFDTTIAARHAAPV